MDWKCVVCQFWVWRPPFIAVCTACSQQTDVFCLQLQTWCVLNHLHCVLQLLVLQHILTDNINSPCDFRFHYLWFLLKTNPTLISPLVFVTLCMDILRASFFTRIKVFFIQTGTETPHRATSICLEGFFENIFEIFWIYPQHDLSNAFLIHSALIFLRQWLFNNENIFGISIALILTISAVHQRKLIIIL